MFGPGWSDRNVWDGLLLLPKFQRSWRKSSLYWLRQNPRSCAGLVLLATSSQKWLIDVLKKVNPCLWFESDVFGGLACPTYQSLWWTRNRIGWCECDQRHEEADQRLEPERRSFVEGVMIILWWFNISTSELRWKVEKGLGLSLKISSETARCP